MTLGIYFLKQYTIIALTSDDNVLNCFGAAALSSNFQLLGNGNSSIILFTTIKIMFANRGEITVMMKWQQWQKCIAWQQKSSWCLHWFTLSSENNKQLWAELLKTMIQIWQRNTCVIWFKYSIIILLRVSCYLPRLLS